MEYWDIGISSVLYISVYLAGIDGRFVDIKGRCVYQGSTQIIRPFFRELSVLKLDL